MHQPVDDIDIINFDYAHNKGRFCNMLMSSGRLFIYGRSPFEGELYISPDFDPFGNPMFEESADAETKEREET